MSDKAMIHVILTMPYRTNRGYLARMLATYLASKGLPVNIGQVPVVDSEPPADVEKGPVVQPDALFYISEHQLAHQFVLGAWMGQTGELICKPPVPDSMPYAGHGIAVIAPAGSGKSSVMKLVCECLNSDNLTKEFVQSIKTLGDETLPPAWQAEKNAQEIKDRVEVIFHVRRSKLNSSLDEILASCDKVDV